MRLQIKWFRFALLALVIALLSIHLIYKMTHCRANGLARSEALIIADRKLKTEFRGSFLSSEFTLEKERFENYDKSWVFTYRARNCKVDIVIDNCGVSDVGGMTEGCIPAGSR